MEGEDIESVFRFDEVDDWVLESVEVTVTAILGSRWPRFFGDAFVELFFGGEE